MRTSSGITGCCALVVWFIFLLTVTHFCHAFGSNQEYVGNRQRRVSKSEFSPAQDFFGMLSDSARSKWGDFWSRDPAAVRAFHADRRPSLEATDELEDEGERAGERGGERGGEGELEGMRDENQLEYSAVVTPLQEDIFDIKRMKRKLQLKKFRTYHGSRTDKQKRKQQRRKQQRKKLMKTVARNNHHISRTPKRAKKPRGRVRDEGPKSGRSERPNIILIVADDLGFNDVPWHNPDVKAPNLLNLARKGVVLENHYVLPLCTPSRAALLTGDYPFRYGKQAGESSPLSPTGLNTSVTLLPQRLKELGYNTHLIGKWHLGYCNWDYTPTRRGFDSFYGFYLGSQTYYTHYKKLGSKKGSQSWLDTNEVDIDHNYEGRPPFASDSLKDDQLQQMESERSKHRERPHRQEEREEDGGLDFRFNETPLSNVSGVYSNELYATRAEELIRAHGTAEGGGRGDRSAKDPLFLMLSMQAVHGPVQVPLLYRRRHRATTKNLARRTFLGMVNALDDAVGRVVAQLKASRLYHNSIIIFTTDNGGNIQAGGNNFPLRGSKGGVFEGGTRGVAFIHSPLLPKSGYKYSGMMHIVDMHETILHVAQKGVALPRGWRKSLLKSRKQDGKGGSGSPKSSLSGGQEGRRDGMNMWPAILTNSESPRNSFIYNVRKKPLRGAIRRKNWKLIIGNGGRYDGWIPPSDVSAGSHALDDGKCCTTWHSRLLSRQVTLYNLKDDPLETTDVSYLNPDVTATLKSILRQYAAQSRQPHMPREDPRGHPNLYGGFFSPGWCEAVV